MSKASSIEWTEDTWNFIAGCSIKSAGCTNCYAMRMAARLEGMAKALKAQGKNPGMLAKYIGLTNKVNGKAVWNGTIAFDETALRIPLQTETPTTYFVNSMSDFCHENVTDEWIDLGLAVMALCPQHTFQILTKRPDRLEKHLTSKRKSDGETKARTIWRIANGFESGNFGVHGDDYAWIDMHVRNNWPLPNVLLGTSVEDQKSYDEREQYLSALHLDGWKTFYSFEPLIGSVEMRTSAASWAIIGGESGPGARTADLEYIRDLIKQLRERDIPIFVKQLGTRCFMPSEDAAFVMSIGGAKGVVSNCYIEVTMKNSKGGDIDHWPEDVRIREFPKGER